MCIVPWKPRPFPRPNPASIFGRNQPPRHSLLRVGMKLATGCRPAPSFGAGRPAKVCRQLEVFHKLTVPGEPRARDSRRWLELATMRMAVSENRRSVSCFG
jgi:hypothetical protein